MESKTVLLVEDDARTRARLARSLTACADLSLAGQAASCREARALLEAGAPDVLVTDLGLPDGSGIELIRLLRERAPGSLSMAITIFGDEKTVVEALEAGASGYLLKEQAPESIADAVGQLLAGGSPISPAIARHLLHRFRGEGAPREAGDAAHKLTEREREILSLAAKGFRHHEIADLLQISPHTVRTHVRNIYEKLEVHTRSSAIYEAVNLGILDLGD